MGQSKKNKKTNKGNKPQKKKNISSAQRQVNINRRVAVLVDAENISVKYIDLILQFANQEGRISCLRAYGDWSSPNVSAWRIPSVRNGFVQIHQPCNTKGKNSSDIALVMDAMDLLYKENYDTFFIATSDADFTRLATRLREDHKKVVGAGENKTSSSFSSQCDRFIYLDREYKDEIERNGGTLEEDEGSEAKQSTKQKAKNEDSKKQKSVQNASNEANHNANKAKIKENRKASELESAKKTLRAIVESKGADTSGWVNICDIGNAIPAELPNFNLNSFGHAKLAPFLRSLGIFEERKVPNPHDPMSPHLFYRVIK